jgi:cyclic dehypoxanthinyl futalosine synthase
MVGCNASSTPIKYYNISATMMFGHIETISERFEHLVWLREVQSEKPADAKGFLAFIPWPFMDDGTLLRSVLKEFQIMLPHDEYIRMIALSQNYVTEC